ncbi:reverse transcriptase domain-containing protein [Tanacetum coccineum]
MEDDFKLAVQHQRRVNPNIQEVITKEVIKLLDAGLIYPIFDSPWVSPVHCVPKKGGMTVVTNEDNELIPTRLVTIWCVCIDYWKLNDATRKDHFPLPFMDQMLEHLAGNGYYCFLDGFFGYFQIHIDLKQWRSSSMISWSSGITSHLAHFILDKNLSMGCEDTNLVLNWEKCHFMVKEGIVLGHKISKSRIEVDKAKVDVIAKLPHPTSVKGIRIFLGHAGFYRRFIQDFSKITRPMTHLLEKDTPFIFLKECIEAFNTLKKKLTEAPSLVAPDWDLPFEIMCDASDYAVGAVLGQLEDHSVYGPLSSQISSCQARHRDFSGGFSYSKNLMSLFVIKKGAENLAADHLSRLENPHQSDLEKKEIIETFPLETLGMVTFRGDSSTPWFTNIENYHAGNFIVKGMSS